MENRPHFWLALFSGALLVSSLQAVGSMPDNWWQTLTPGDILVQATHTTEAVPCLKAGKIKTINDPDRGFVLFQRRHPAGVIETKKIRMVRSQASSMTFNLESGRYFVDMENGKPSTPIKDEFESDTEIESRVAAHVANPYQYFLFKSELVGINGCIVIRSQMSQGMVEALAGEFHKAMPNFDVKYIRTIKDYYIRKSDGIMLGYLGRTADGRLMDDQLADTLEAPAIVSDEEFLVPKMGNAVKAKSLDVAVDISTSNMLSSLKDTNQKNERTRSGLRLVLGILALAPIIWFLFRLKFQRRASKQILLGDVEKKQ